MKHTKKQVKNFGYTYKHISYISFVTCASPKAWITTNLKSQTSFQATQKNVWHCKATQKSVWNVYGGICFGFMSDFRFFPRMGPWNLQTLNGFVRGNANLWGLVMDFGYKIVYWYSFCGMLQIWHDEIAHKFKKLNLSYKVGHSILGGDTC